MNAPSKNDSPKGDWLCIAYPTSGGRCAVHRFTTRAEAALKAREFNDKELWVAWVEGFPGTEAEKVVEAEEEAARAAWSKRVQDLRTAGE